MRIGLKSNIFVSNTENKKYEFIFFKKKKYDLCFPQHIIIIIIIISFVNNIVIVPMWQSSEFFKRKLRSRHQRLFKENVRKKKRNDLQFEKKRIRKLFM